MARSPRELLTTVTGREKELNDELERLIDERMDQDYTGGSFRYYLDDELSPRRLLDLNRRYKDWVVTQDHVSQYNETTYYLWFSPRDGDEDSTG